MPIQIHARILSARGRTWQMARCRRNPKTPARDAEGSCHGLLSQVSGECVGACYIECMAKEAFNPLMGSGIRIRDREELEDFLCMPNAADAVRASSFEQVFFTLKSIGLADSFELLSLASAKQIRGFVDLDCWRKDSFVRKPFMEWIAAFVQGGPELASEALAGIDDDVVALFMKDLITVYELDRDDPPPAGELMYTPDNTLAVRIDDAGDAATICGLILDVVLSHNPGLGYKLLRKVRYTTRTELEEMAYQNKVRRLDVHGFVDYYEALSIYAGPANGEAPVRPREREEDGIPGEDPPQSLPTVFADSLAEGGFLLAAMGRVSGDAADRLAEELTALGNRVLSANLVNLGEVEGIRTALGEMRDFLTIGLEHLSGGDAAVAADLLLKNHVQWLFKSGFDLLAGLRGTVEKMARIPGFKPELLEHPDQEFVAGLARFKPLLWDAGRYRHFRELSEVEAAAVRLDKIRIVSRFFLDEFGPSIETTLRQAFNTAVIQLAVSGRFEPTAVESQALKSMIADGVSIPVPEVPEELREILGDWLETLRADLEPLVGKPIDPRFVGFVTMKF